MKARAPPRRPVRRPDKGAERGAGEEDPVAKDQHRARAHLIESFPTLAPDMFGSLCVRACACEGDGRGRRERRTMRIREMKTKGSDDGGTGEEAGPSVESVCRPRGLAGARTDSQVRV